MKERAKHFFQNAGVLALAALIGKTISIYFGSYLSRTIGAEGMGLVGLISTAYGFATTFAVSGIPLGVTRLVSEAIGRGETGGARRALRHATLYALAFSTIATIALLLGAGWIGRVALGDGRTISSLRLLALSLIPLSLASVMNGYFTAVGRVGGNALTQIVELLIRIFSTAILLAHIPFGDVESGVLAVTRGLVLSQFFSCFALGVLFLWDTKRHLPKLLPGERGGGGFGPLMQIALPLAFSTYVRSGLLTVEHILIPISLTKGGASHSESLAAYGVLQGMALPVVLYPMAILSACSPLLVPLFATHGARHEKAEIRGLATRALHLTSLLAMGCFTLLFVFSEEFGIVLYQNPEVGQYIRPLSCVIPLMFLDHVTDGILKGLGEQVYTMWVNILDAILSIVLVWLLLPHFGAMGYVYVILLAEVINFSLSILRLYRVSRVTYRPIRSLLLPASAGLVAGYLVSHLVPVDPYVSTLFWLGLRLLFAAAVYIGTLFLAKIVERALKGWPRALDIGS